MLKKSLLVITVALLGINTADAHEPCRGSGWLLVVESPFSVARRVTCGAKHIVGDVAHGAATLVSDVAVGAKDVVVYSANGVVHTVKQVPRAVHHLFCPCHRCRIPRKSVIRVPMRFKPRHKSARIIR